MRYIKFGEPCPYCADRWTEDNIIENIKTEILLFVGIVRKNCMLKMKNRRLELTPAIYWIVGNLWSSRGKSVDVCFGGLRGLVHRLSIIPVVFLASVSAALEVNMKMFFIRCFSYYINLFSGRKKNEFEIPFPKIGKDIPAYESIFILIFPKVKTLGFRSD